MGTLAEQCIQNRRPLIQFYTHPIYSFQLLFLNSMSYGQTNQLQDTQSHKRKRPNQQPDFDHSYFRRHGYQVTAEIGRGGYGTVYLVKDVRESHRTFAVKINFDVVSRPVIFLQSTVYYLLKEKKCIPKLHDIFCEKSIVHIVLEYFQHAPYIQLFHKMTDMQHVQHYMMELLKCMLVLKEAGIYHRDIKPQNFLYNPEKKKGVIVDFGLAELDKSFFSKIKRKFHKFKKAHKEDRQTNEEFMQMKSQYDLYKQLYKATKESGRKKIGTQSYVPLQSLAYADNQGYECQIWSAGTILLQFLSRKYHFFHNIKTRNETKENQFKYITIFMLQLAHFFGAQQVKKVLVDIGFDVQMPYKIKQANIDNIISLKSESPSENEAALDLLKKMLQITPKKRISVQDAIMHPFFDSVREQHFETPEDQKWIQEYLEKKKNKEEEAKKRADRISLQDFQLNSRDRINIELEEEEKKKKNNECSTKGKINSELLSNQIDEKSDNSSFSQYGSDEISDVSQISDSISEELKKESHKDKKKQLKSEKSERNEKSKKNIKKRLKKKEYFDESSSPQEKKNQLPEDEKSIAIQVKKIQTEIKEELSQLREEESDFDDDIQQGKSESEDQGNDILKQEGNKRHKMKIKIEKLKKKKVDTLTQTTKKSNFEVENEKALFDKKQERKQQKQAKQFVKQKETKKEDFNKKICSLFSEHLSKAL